MATRREREWNGESDGILFDPGIHGDGRLQQDRFKETELVTMIMPPKWSFR